MNFPKFGMNYVLKVNQQGDRLRLRAVPAWIIIESWDGKMKDSWRLIELEWTNLT